MHLVFYDFNDARTVEVHTGTPPATANCDKAKRRRIGWFAATLFGRLAIG